MTSIANDGNNNNDDSLRSTAVIENEEELLNLIKNKVSLKEKTIKGLPPIIYATSLYDEDLACDIVNNGVDVDYFRPKVPREIKLNHWLYVGGFQSNKRVDRLLKAFDYCFQHHSNLRLTVIGAEHYSGQWNDLTRGLSCNKALNHFSYLKGNELLDAFHSRGLFVSAAEFEGFGLASMEALASGSLLILHPNKSFLDLFSGLAEFADFNRPKKVLQAYNLLLKMSERDLIERATSGIAKSEIYSWKRVAREIENHYLSAN